MKFYVSLLLCFLPLFLVARESIPLSKQIASQSGPVFGEKRDWTIRNITFKGKLRTKTKVALGILNIHQGMVITNISIVDLRKKLEHEAKKDKYFYDLEVVFKPTPPYLDLELRIKEKWSLFPIPVISYSDSRWSYGFGVLEGNFLGSKNQIGGAVVYKDDYLSFTAIGNFDKLFVKNLGLFATVFSAKKKKYFYDEYTFEDKGSYKETGTGYILNFRYDIQPVRLWLRHTLVRRSYGEPEATTNVPPSAGTESMLDLSIILKEWTSLEDYEQGYWFRFTLGRDMGWLGSDFGRTIFNWSFSFALNVVKSHNILIDHSGLISNKVDERLLLEIGNSTSGWNPSILGYRSGQYGARHFIYNSLEYRIPFASTKLLNFSIVGFTQHMTFTRESRLGNLKHIFNVGLSFRIYLRRLLLPAVVVYGVYAEDNNNFDFGVSLGASI